MKIKTFGLLILAILLFVSCGFAGTRSKEELAALAASADPSVSNEAIKELRALGADGLDVLLRKYAAEIAKFSERGEQTGEWKRIARAIDTVAMQKDAYASGLFWYTDFEEAKREAAKSGKPILSLRLLGNLNEEFSCANSRFFRALLYSNREISRYLRENYVLHWKSVRPAPRVTIDFGDGRRIERTITGNSIHYILNAKGEIIDALPGLYSPDFFLKYLAAARNYRATRYFETIGVDEIQNTNVAFRFRRERFNEIISARNQAVGGAKVELTEPSAGTDALTVAPRAVTKMVTERFILTGMEDGFARYEPQIDLENWKKLSKLYAGATRFDDASIAFIKRQNAQTGLTDAQFTSLLENLETLVALDTTRNDFLFHTKLYEWLNAGRGEALDLEQFNDRVYAELFKTPDADRWLGLYNADVYTALDGNGVVK